MEQLSVEDWKPDACPKNVTVEEYLATFPKIKLTREYLQTIPLYHAALYLAETTQKVHSSQEWYLYLNEKVDQNGEVLSGEYDVSGNQLRRNVKNKKHMQPKGDRRCYLCMLLDGDFTCSHIWKSIMFCLVTPMHLQRRKG